MAQNELSFNDIPASIQELKISLQEIRQLIETQSQTPKNRLLVLAEACELLNLSKPSVYRLVNERRIPFHKLPGSKRLYFFEDQILDFIKNGRKKFE